MTAMTLLSRVLGLVREQVRAHYLGTGSASDAFGLASMLPNLFRRLFAEGAMTAAFIPVLVETMEKGKAAVTKEFLSKFVTFLSCVAILFSIAGLLATPWIIDTFFSSEFRKVEGKVELTVALTELMWPYLAFISIAALFQAILNAHKIFGPSAFTPVLLNLSIIGCGVAFADAFSDPAYGLVIGFLVGGVVQAAFQLPYIWRWTTSRFSLDFRFRHPQVRRVLIIMGPGIFAAGIYQINVFVSQLIASGLEGGSIASLQYGIRLQELVLGLFVVSIAQVILPTLSQQTAQNDEAAVKDTLRYATGLMGYVTLPATAGLILVGPEVVRLLFQFGEFDDRSVNMTVTALNFYAAGLLVIALGRVYQQVFYAYKDLKTPTYVAFATMVANIVLCIVLSEPLAHGGIALAGSLSAGLGAFLLLWLLRRKMGALGGPEMTSRLLRMGIATALMTGAVLGFEQLWAAPPGRLMLLVWLGVVVTLAAAVFVIACRVMGVDELAGLWRSVARKLGRSKK